MKYYLKHGWGLAQKQPVLILLLFVYQLVWGTVISHFIKTIVVPIMYRYPGGVLSKDAVQVFWAEGQFQLTKTDLIHSYAWTLLIMLAIRMVLTPFINAGIYYSLHHTDLHQAYRFVHGIRKHSKAFFGLYAVKTLLQLLPLVGVWYKLKDSLDLSNVSSFLLPAVPWILIYLVYSYLLHIVFMYI